MRDRWLTAMVLALSALALVGSVLFACTRSADGSAAEQTTQPASVTGVQAAPKAEPAGDPAQAPEESAAGPSCAAVFDARCKRCHSLEETVGLVRKQPADKREPWLTELLGRHFPPPVPERPALVRYLLAETARSER
jgi:cytochrome c5